MWATTTCGQVRVVSGQSISRKGLVTAEVGFVSYLSAPSAIKASVGASKPATAPVSPRSAFPKASSPTSKRLNPLHHAVQEFLCA